MAAEEFDRKPANTSLNTVGLSFCGAPTGMDVDCARKLASRLLPAGTFSCSNGRSTMVAFGARCLAVWLRRGEACVFLSGRARTTAPGTVKLVARPPVFFSCNHFYFPTQLVGGFTLSNFLDKPWSQVSSLLPPGTCLQFLWRIGFSIPTARRFSSNIANSRSRAFRISIFMQEKVPATMCTR